MATKGYKGLHGITVKQQQAVDRLVADDTDEQAAQAADVHRVTVTRRRSHNPTFPASLHVRRQEVWCAPKVAQTTAQGSRNAGQGDESAQRRPAANTILNAAALDKLMPTPFGIMEPAEGGRVHVPILNVKTDQRLKDIG